MFDILLQLDPVEWPVLGTYCCSQFIVSRERITSHQPYFYHNLVRVLLGDIKQKQCSQDDGHDNRPRIGISALLEGMWHTVFGEDHELPLREYDTRLPDFLRAKEKYHQADAKNIDYHLSNQPNIALAP